MDEEVAYHMAHGAGRRGVLTFVTKPEGQFERMEIV